ASTNVPRAPPAIAMVAGRELSVRATVVDCGHAAGGPAARSALALTNAEGIGGHGAGGGDELAPQLARARRQQQVALGIGGLLAAPVGGEVAVLAVVVGALRHPPPGGADDHED